MNRLLPESNFVGSVQVFFFVLNTPKTRQIAGKIFDVFIMGLYRLFIALAIACRSAPYRFDIPVLCLRSFRLHLFQRNEHFLNMLFRCRLFFHFFINLAADADIFFRESVNRRKGVVAVDIVFNKLFIINIDFCSLLRFLCPDGFACRISYSPSNGGFASSVLTKEKIDRPRAQRRSVNRRGMHCNLNNA